MAAGYLHLLSIPQQSKSNNGFKPAYRPPVARLPGNQSPIFRSVMPDPSTPELEWYCKERYRHEDPSQTAEALERWLSRLVKDIEAEDTEITYSRITLAFRPRNSTVGEAKGHNILEAID